MTLSRYPNTQTVLHMTAAEIRQQKCKSSWKEIPNHHQRSQDKIQSNSFKYVSVLYIHT